MRGTFSERWSLLVTSTAVCEEAIFRHEENNYFFTNATHIQRNILHHYNVARSNKAK